MGYEFDFLKNINDSIPVTFSGDLKFLCVEPFVAPAGYSYSEIKIKNLGASPRGMNRLKIFIISRQASGN